MFMVKYSGVIASSSNYKEQRLTEIVSELKK